MPGKTLQCRAPFVEQSAGSERAGQSRLAIRLRRRAGPVASRHPTPDGTHIQLQSLAPWLGPTFGQAFPLAKRGSSVSPMRLRLLPPGYGKRRGDGNGWRAQEYPAASRPRCRCRPLPPEEPRALGHSGRWIRGHFVHLSAEIVLALTCQLA